MYSSSPPPMDDGPEDEDSEFGDFGTFSAVSTSISLTELDTDTTFNQALNATSPPELLAGRGVLRFGHAPSLKANGVAPAGHRGDGPSDRTESNSVLAGSPGHPVSPAGSRGPETLTNGFVTFDLQGGPSLQNSVQAHSKGTSPEDPDSPQDDFADFAAFSEAGGRVGDPEAEDALRDSNRTGTRESESTSAPAETPDGSSEPDRGPGPPSPTNRPATLNGLDSAREAAHSQSEQVHGKSSDTETETETSLGRLLSTDALEEYGDTSTPGSSPSTPLQGEPATHQDDQDDQDAPGLPQTEQDWSRPHSSVLTQQRPEDGDDDFGDFKAPQVQGGEQEETVAGLPVSDSFGTFSSAADGPDAGSGWSAFGEAEQEEGAESWAEFSTEPHPCAPAEGGEEEQEEVEGAEVGGESNRTTVSRDAAVRLVRLGERKTFGAPDWLLRQKEKG